MALRLTPRENPEIEYQSADPHRPSMGRRIFFGVAAVVALLMGLGAAVVAVLGFWYLLSTGSTGAREVWLSQFAVWAIIGIGAVILLGSGCRMILAAAGRRGFAANNMNVRR